MSFSFARKLLLAAACLASTPAIAADAQMFSSVEASGRGQYFGQVGLVLPFWGQQLGNGFVHRYIVNGVTYDYDKSGLTIDGKAYQGEFSLGYQGSTRDGAWWGAYAGVAYRHTELSPSDPTSDAEGDHVGGNFQVEGEMPVWQNFKLNGIAAYSTINNGYFTRARVMYRISGDIFAGPEGILQGDDDYEAYAYGLAINGFRPMANSNLGFKLGVRKVDGQSASPSGGVEFSTSF